MKTIKLPVEYDNVEDQQIVENIQRVYSSAFRYAFNRFKKDFLNQKEVRELCRGKFQEQLGSWLLQNAIIEAQYVFKKYEGDGVNPVFGGVYNIERYMKGLISKDEFKKRRLNPVCSQGEKSKRGNRLFELEIENRKIVFKYSQDIRINLRIPELRKNYRRLLTRLQESAKNKLNNFTVKFYWSFA